MMTALSDSSDVLYIFMPITGVKKGHDLMNQNLPSISCLRIITSMMIFSLIISTDATSSSDCGTQCKKVGLNILKIGICLTIKNKSII